jgi:hypothetical protein
METKAGYKVGDGPALEDFKGLACTLRIVDDGYQAPTPAQVDALIKAAGWSQNDVAKLVGVSYSDKGSLTVRRWRTDPKWAEHREIPYSAWRLMLLASGVVDRP